jgi:hypothetical protein
VPGWTTRTCSNTACCTSEHYMQDYTMIRAQWREDRTVPGCTTRTCSNTACCTSAHYMQDLYHDPCTRVRTRTMPRCTTCTCSNTACCTSEHFIMIRAPVFRIIGYGPYWKRFGSCNHNSEFTGPDSAIGPGPIFIFCRITNKIPVVPIFRMEIPKSQQ